MQEKRGINSFRIQSLKKLVRLVRFACSEYRLGSEPDSSGHCNKSFNANQYNALAKHAG